MTPTWWLKGSHTFDPTGLTGWIAPWGCTGPYNINDDDPIQEGTYDINGAGQVYIVHDSNDAVRELQVRVSKTFTPSIMCVSGNPNGFDFSEFSLDISCTIAKASKNHGILLNGGFPAIAAYCQDFSIYFCKSNNIRGHGGWSFQKVLNGGIAVSEPDIHINGAGFIFITYRTLSGEIHVIQSTSTTGFL
jgi:hypothetical protein